MERIPVTGKAKANLQALVTQAQDAEKTLRIYMQAFLDSNEAEGQWKLDLQTFELVKQEEPPKK